MSFLERLFGPSRETIWRQLADEIDAAYVAGGGWRGDRVVATDQGWTVTLDTEFNAATKQTDTRMHARFRNPSEFTFTVYRRGLFTELGKALGMQDVEVGHDAFDRDFVIKGSDEARLKRFFANDRIRQLLEAQPDVHFSVTPKGWLHAWRGGEAGPREDDLVFTVPGVLKDKARLKALFDLFAETLDELTR